ncbi:WD repeat-containing protein 44, variant 2 [Perkinsus olseni]|nr:WD repeat-containing protein 44, variant 2 [Perkinsus olseni]
MQMSMHKIPIGGGGGTTGLLTSSSSSTSIALQKYYAHDTPESLKAARKTVLDAVKAMDKKFSVSWDDAAKSNLPNAVKDITNGHDDNTSDDTDNAIIDNDHDTSSSSSIPFGTLSGDDVDDTTTRRRRRKDSNDGLIGLSKRMKKRNNHTATTTTNTRGMLPRTPSSPPKWLFRNRRFLGRGYHNEDAVDKDDELHDDDGGGRVSRPHHHHASSSNKAYLIPRLGVLPPGQLRRASSVGMVIPPNANSTTSSRSIHHSLNNTPSKSIDNDITAININKNEDDDGIVDNCDAMPINGDGGGGCSTEQSKGIRSSSSSSSKKKDNTYITTTPTITGLHIRGRVKHLLTRLHRTRGEDDINQLQQYDDDEGEKHHELMMMNEYPCCWTEVCGSTGGNNDNNTTPRSIPLVTSVPNNPNTHCILLLGEMYLPPLTSSSSSTTSDGPGGFIATQIAVDKSTGDIAVGTSNGMIFVWIRDHDASHSRSPTLQLKGHIDSITSLHYSSSIPSYYHSYPTTTTILVSSSLDGSTVIWTPRKAASLQKGYTHHTTTRTNDDDDDAVVCDTKPLAVIRHFKPITGPLGIEGTGINIPTYASTVLPTNDNGLRTPLLFVACADGAVEIYELAMDRASLQSPDYINNHDDDDDDADGDGGGSINGSYYPKRTHTVRIEGMATAVALSPDGLRLAVGSAVGTVTMFLLKTLRLDGVIDCRNRYGKLKGGRKITGMQWQKDSQR